MVSGTTQFLQSLVEEKRTAGLRVGVLTTEEQVDVLEADVVLACGKREELETVATALYDTLRKFNLKQVDIIFSEVFPNEGVGNAIMNRLQKAAGNKLIAE